MSPRCVWVFALRARRSLPRRAGATQESPPLGTRAQAELKEKLASTYDVKDQQAIFLFGFRTQVCTAARSPVRSRRGAHSSQLQRDTATQQRSSASSSWIPGGGRGGGWQGGRHTMRQARARELLRAVWRWQVHRLRPHLRRRQVGAEVRAQVPSDPGACSDDHLEQQKARAAAGAGAAAAACLRNGGRWEQRRPRGPARFGRAEDGSAMDQQPGEEEQHAAVELHGGSAEEPLSRTWLGAAWGTQVPRAGGGSLRPLRCCRAAQNGLAKKIEKSRKQKKERRNRARKVRGVKKGGECGRGAASSSTWEGAQRREHPA